jgi:hypothetical protein
VTLDGIMEAPGHEEHPDGKNSSHSSVVAPRAEESEIGEVIET